MSLNNSIISSLSADDKFVLRNWGPENRRKPASCIPPIVLAALVALGSCGFFLSAYTGIIPHAPKVFLIISGASAGTTTLLFFSILGSSPFFREDKETAAKNDLKYKWDRKFQLQGVLIQTQKKQIQELETELKATSEEKNELREEIATKQQQLKIWELQRSIYVFFDNLEESNKSVDCKEIKDLFEELREAESDPRFKEADLNSNSFFNSEELREEYVRISNASKS